MLRTMRKWTLIAIALCLGRALGQEVYPPSSDSRGPKVHVLDDARIFSSEPARLAALEARLREIEVKDHFPVYVAIYDTLIGTDVKERSQELQRRWVGSDAPGMVAVVETDSGNVSLGVHPVKHFELQSGAELPNIGPLDFTLLEQDSISRLVQERAGSLKDRRAKVEAVVNGLADEVGRNLAARQAPASNTAHIRTLVFTAGLVVAAILSGLLALAWLRRSDTRARQRFIFPDVNVGIRLGAPYGGGKISSRSFSEPPDSRP
jgi:hypothetical protein